MTLPFNQVFETPFRFDVGLDEVDPDVSMAARRDGRIMGLLVESLLAPKVAQYGYRHAPSKEYDYQSINTTFHLECKGANHRGTNLSPSNMIGKGRAYDHEKFVETSVAKHYMVVDTTPAAQGKLRYMFLEGTQVAKMEAKKQGRLSAAEVKVLFENATKSN